MKRKLAFPLALLMFVVAYCRPAKSPDQPAQNAPVSVPAKTDAPAHPAINPSLDDLASFMSGLPVKSEPYEAWQGQPEWQNFRKAIDESWAPFDKQILEPMERWAGEELADARRETRTIFNPFGGPDFITVFAFFPGAEKMILMGLEPVGNLPDFEKDAPEARAAFFKDFDTILPDFLKRGYFVTEHMNEVYAAGRVDGSLPVVIFFLKRTGCAVVDIKRLGRDENGAWIETPYKRIPGLPKRPYGVRIDYLERGGRGPLHSVYYFSCDLEDKAFAVDSPLYRFFDGLEDLSTCIKSASYLMHYAEFANIRNLILKKSRFVIEDDTGIPFRYFKSQGWGIRLFGEYTKPVEDFSGVEQADLKQAYEDPAAGVKKLPFHYGYRWQTHIDNLMIMTRPAKAPGASSVPVGR